MKINKSAMGDVLDIYGEEVIIDHEDDEIGNSFFETRRHGVRVLFIAKKTVDLINFAGNMILNLSRSHANIFVICTKSCDIKPLEFLGIERDKILDCELNFQKTILDMKADIIFCTEFDDLFANFKFDNEYIPEIYEMINCERLSDFYADNLLETKIEKKYSNWSQRIRFPVAEDCRIPLMKNNPLDKAIFNYGELNALKILNSDEVFFERQILPNEILLKVLVENKLSQVIKPFIKITVNDNFIYEYFVPKSVNKIELEIYRFHTDKPIELTVSDGVIYCRHDKCVLSFDCDSITVRAEIADDPKIYDQVKIRRVSLFHFWHLRLKQLLEKFIFYFKRFKMLQELQ